MTAPEGFVTEYAIRMPNGDLVTNALDKLPYVWTSEEHALNALNLLRQRASLLGITEWSGVVERRYCTPFIRASDPADGLMDELSTWLKTQTGEQQ